MLREFLRFPNHPVRGLVGVLPAQRSRCRLFTRTSPKLAVTPRGFFSGFGVFRPQKLADVKFASALGAVVHAANINLTVWLLKRIFKIGHYQTLRAGVVLPRPSLVTRKANCFCSGLVV